MAELAKKMDPARPVENTLSGVSTGAKDISDREGKYLALTVAEVRGKVIPVVDLRLRFGMEEMEYTDRICIIVVEIAGSTGTVQIGIVVDSLSEVLHIKGEEIEDTSTFETRLNIDYILGMAKMDGGVKIMIDRERKYLTLTVAEVRGKVIPVVDLRLRLGMEEMEYADRTCIIVVEIAGSTETVQIGIVVDSVSEVLHIKVEDIEDTPTFETRLNIDYTLGMVKTDGGVKIMIDIDKVLSQQELELVSAMKKEDSSVAPKVPAEKTVEAETAPEEMEAVEAPLGEIVAEETAPEEMEPEEASPEKTVEAEVPQEKTAAEEAPLEHAHNKSKGDRDHQYFSKNSIYAFLLLILVI